MAFKSGERDQISLFPTSLDSSVSLEDPVRAYDAFIDAINLEELGLEINEHKVGNSEYHPKSMLKLLVYAYSYGWRSSRKIERALHHNLSFIWLVGGLKPDFKTISEFRRNNKTVLSKLLKQCARLCIQLDLIEGNTLFLDGTKMRANASRNKSFTKAKYDRILTKVDQRIEEILVECDNVDHSEKDQSSLVKMKKELSNKEELKTKIEHILKDFEIEGEKTKNGKYKKKNLTDPECKNMNSVQGAHASYNIQSVVDAKNKLIVNIDTVSDSSDINLFSDQIIKAEKVTEKECQQACADAGYANVNRLEEIDARGTKVIVPSQRQALHDEEKPFCKNTFQYDEALDCYYCPEEKVLNFTGSTDNGEKLTYTIEQASNCLSCKNYGVCTKSKTGRTVTRLKKEDLKQKLEKQYEEEDSQEIYKQRKCSVEHPFGHIKRNLGMTSFLLKGKAGAQSEISIAATCFNIVRMITIYGGVSNFINTLKTM